VVPPGGPHRGRPGGLTRFEFMAAGGEPCGVMPAGVEPFEFMAAGGEPCGVMPTGGEPCGVVPTGGEPCGVVRTRQSWPREASHQLCTVGSSGAHDKVESYGEAGCTEHRETGGCGRRGSWDDGQHLVVCAEAAPQAEGLTAGSERVGRMRRWARPQPIARSPSPLLGLLAHWHAANPREPADRRSARRRSTSLRDAGAEPRGIKSR
jgi:hypothetical protein